MSSVGEFVKSKMHNMAVWVQEELGSVIAIDYVAAVDARSELELTTLCAMLHSRKESRRTVTGALSSRLQASTRHLRRCCRSSTLCADVSMHEKFWKYVKLFIDVIEE